MLTHVSTVQLAASAAVSCSYIISALRNVFWVGACVYVSCVVSKLMYM